MANNPPVHWHPAHHPDDDQLMTYATGEMAEAPSLVIATHLALCPDCRRHVADYEALGGELLGDLPGELLSPGSLSHTLEMLDVAAPEEPAATVPGAPADFAIPQPLRDYIARAAPARTGWRRASPGLRTLKLKAEGAKIWMMELQSGRPIPHHGHRGGEMVLVISGGYHDGPAGYGPGDVQNAGLETIHEPVADADSPCLCLVLEEGAIRPTSLVGRIVSGLLGY